MKDAFAFSHDARNAFPYTCCRTCIPLPYGLGAWDHWLTTSTKTIYQKRARKQRKQLSTAMPFQPGCAFSKGTGFPLLPIFFLWFTLSFAKHTLTGCLPWLAVL